MSDQGVLLIHVTVQEDESPMEMLYCRINGAKVYMSLVMLALLYSAIERFKGGGSSGIILGVTYLLLLLPLCIAVCQLVAVAAGVAEEMMITDDEGPYSTVTASCHCRTYSR